MHSISAILLNFWTKFDPGTFTQVQITQNPGIGSPTCRLREEHNTVSSFYLLTEIFLWLVLGWEEIKILEQQSSEND